MLYKTEMMKALFQYKDSVKNSKVTDEKMKGRVAMKTKLTLSALMACLIVGNVGFAETTDNYNKNYIRLSSSELTINNEELNLNYTGFHSVEVKNDNTKLQINSKNINMSATPVGTIASNIAAGIYADTSSDVIIGNESTENVNIKVNSKGSLVSTAGIYAGPSGTKIDINSKNVNIDVYSQVNNVNTETLAGIWVQSNTTDESDESKISKVTINSEKTIINVNGTKNPGIGLLAMSQGIIDVKGDLEVNAGSAIAARGNATVNVNKDGNRTVKLNGDIEFNYEGETSGSLVDADININLTNSESYLNGNILITGNPSEDKRDVTGMTLGLSNNARWITDADSFVNNLNLDGGIINAVGGEEQTITVQNFSGNGSVNMQTTVEGDKYSTAKLELGKDPNGSNTPGSVTGNLNVNFTGITADDVKDAKSAMEQLVSGVKINGTQENFNASANVKEGLLNGSISSEFNNDSTLVEGSLHQNSSTTTMDNMRDIASVALIAWRQEDSTLSQRLGELRNSEGDQGIWVRMNRGEFEYGGAFKNQYNFFQLGYDKAYGDWHYGAAISHNDGQTTYSDGSGDNSSTSLSLYGTWLGDKGHYADIVLKEGRLSNEFENYAEAGYTKGDYDAWGTSISGEYGRKIDFKNGWFVTPQAQMTYMYITGEDYTTNNGISVSQDSMQSVVGRIGFEVGKEINDFGSIYAKASLLHEFAGDADTYLSMNGISNSYTQDLSDTWYEAGLGLNYRTSENTYVYADVVKTYGGDIETPWQWNVGVRYSF